MSYGIEKEILVDEIEGLLRERNIKSLDEELGENSLSFKDKANSLVRKLIDYGWVYKETTNNYKEIINFNDYAIVIIDALKKIINKETLEYQGNIISIYHLLYSTENINNGVLLKQVFENTKEILGALKTLNANIKKYIDALTKQQTPEEIMEALFKDYMINIIDKSYHRLRTSDNISKYRPKIISKLEELSYDNNFIDNAAKFFMEEENLKELEDGKEKVINIIQDVIYAFNNLDDIMEEIDSKNSKYQRAAVTRAKFLLNNSRDLVGQVKRILQFAAESYKDTEMKLTDETIEEIMDLFTLYTHGYIDETSLYTSNEGKKSFAPKALVLKNISKEERERKIAEFRKNQEKKYTLEKMNNIVLELLQDKTMMYADDIEIRSVEDFIKLIYIRLYGTAVLAKYKLKKREDMINNDGYSYKNFEIWRK
ncbi:Wadjet anti-phage system protein JetA family protein [Clostridium sp. ZS2-4]|uniref:Wadjet anti-phage system protein JetA family protein n=1 Tax=Clostridium sp. ZS2-4 TaxID=2987703 RepID=UPI003FA3CA80